MWPGNLYQAGHEWHAAPRNRTHSTLCPSDPKDGAVIRLVDAHSNVAVHDRPQRSEEEDGVEEASKDAEIGEGAEQRVVGVWHLLACSSGIHCSGGRRLCTVRDIRPVTGEHRRRDVDNVRSRREGRAELNEEGDDVGSVQLAEGQEEESGADGLGCHSQHTRKPSEDHSQRTQDQKTREDERNTARPRGNVELAGWVREVREAEGDDKRDPVAVRIAFGGIWVQ